MLIVKNGTQQNMNTPDTEHTTRQAAVEASKIELVSLPDAEYSSSNGYKFVPSLQRTS